MPRGNEARNSVSAKLNVERFQKPALQSNFLISASQLRCQHSRAHTEMDWLSLAEAEDVVQHGCTLIWAAHNPSDASGHTSTQSREPQAESCLNTFLSLTFTLEDYAELRT
jgi:hypothetical protein